MYIAILVSLLAMLFAYLESVDRNKYGLKIAFGIITIYMAIRYDYGNDYMSYLESFYRYFDYNGSLFDLESLKDMHAHNEYGWVFLNLLFRPIGFFGLIIVLAIVENWIIYDAVKTYVPKKWYVFALFIYVFNPNLLVLGGSMMRQWLAICIFIFAFRFIRDRKPIRYFIYIMVAITIHSSAVILFPLYFITYLRNVNISFKSLFWFIPLLVFWFIVSPQWFSNNLDWLLSGDEAEFYAAYTTNSSGETDGILGIIAAFLYPIICLSQTNKFDSQLRLLIYLFFCSVFIRPLGLVVGMVHRLGFYFMVFSIVVFPMVMEKVRKIRLEWVYVLLVIIIVPTLRDFYAFFHSNVWIKTYMHYHTIFSVPWQ